MAKRNFLLGKGERLVEDVAGVRGGAPKTHPYTFTEARARLAPMLARTVRGIDQLPAEACPDDRAVAAVVLNPEYIAKSYFPEKLFEAVGVEPVGSRPRRITPEKRSKGRPPEKTLTTELFVMGPRSAFRAWRSSLPNWDEDLDGAADLLSIEQVAAPSARDKIKGRLPKGGEAVFEVVLHNDGGTGSKKLLPQFQDYLSRIGIDQHLGRRFSAGGLTFVEIEAPVELADRIATFSPVRALRQMPTLRMLRPTFRSSRVPMENVSLPEKMAPIDPSIRVAIFDGGVPKGHPIRKWTKAIEPPGIGHTIDEFQKHGVGVTSAFLFGHIDPKKGVGQPYAPVDHYRVLDTAPGQNPHELYEVLGRIDKVLVEKEYDFVNLSIGPRLPIEDDDIHAWTAVIDDRLSRGTTLATIAVGNDGDGSAEDGLNRIQVPADCVNAIAVGACDSPEAPWQRCTYSSVGPGRSPGLIKPDFLDFGGCLQRPFIVVSDGTGGLEATEGTSFSAPSVLRLATGIKAHFGDALSVLAIRALLVHTTEGCDFSCQDAGRGRVARSVQDIVLCDDDTVRVVYQGTIAPTRYIRVPIPVPSGTIPGKITIAATLCYPTGVDPHHPGNYTRAGLEPTFRPHDQKRKDPKQVHADTKSFFGKTQKGMLEDELRRDAWKWENCLHTTVSFQGKTLRNPMLDIHYNARLGGRNFTPDQKLPYALVVSVHAKHLGDLYDQIVRKYARQLEALRPVVEIPITT